MNLNLHRNARTTPAIRQELRESTKSERELAREYNLNRATVRKWRRRETDQDASHRPHRIHATLSSVQEQVVVALRQTLLLPLDDLLAVTREFIHPAVSRSGLDRCLRRHGVSNLSALIPQPEGETQPVKTFKDYEPGFVHKEFTDRFCATGEREPTGRHLFDQGCAHHGIEHRLIAPRHPQTNGMVERFNGRIAEVLATTRFDSAQNLADTLTGYVRLYNHQIPQSEHTA
ncbi:integrase-like protein [Thiobaca trueperi]|uniref:Integrase-like protein n=1 Tax=Thiobaca trueperi TaxID=127458 RepID=A0A4R3MY01_9GAMM|nr:integrase-like protein [Thiobaca trueperi]